MSKIKIYLQPTPVRIWHWINATGFIALILSGIQIRFPEYVNLFGSYKAAISLHNAAGLVVAVSFSLWFFYYKMVAGTILKLYMPNSEDLRHGLLRQGIFYFFKYFKGEPNPHHTTPDNKFNPLQKSAYLAVMFILVPMVSLTGLLIMNVTPLRDLVVIAGGLKILANLHFLFACSLCAFLFTHVYLATLGHTPLEHFKPMWTGWEEIDEEKAEGQAAELGKVEPGR
ncbi:cytochrome b/b6 domain-containing protein [Geobacter pelophilus]|jgi:thiosulfate reductase cytochrome b subunit|uniref:Cytochrome b/b6 domain-containing protein n=1 Tax=Geoanaerobacter pelophilus TaxID=60036 RepID=A0AAW4L9B3_9BACT|nr:cytochrome b/b6 domain-containing protein [Geoanaerobacter pelophilus]MBT0663761.1 cytochrome b/b6 domain-containing protein [Geoanaerobacter pelophilus]